MAALGLNTTPNNERRPRLESLNKPRAATEGRPYSTFFGAFYFFLWLMVKVLRKRVTFASSSLKVTAAK